MAQIGLGLGAGLAAAKVMGDALTGTGQATPAAQSPSAAAGVAAAMMACPKCQQQNPVAAKFCNNCGAQLSGTVKCAHCGIENPLGSTFCNNCGNKL